MKTRSLPVINIVARICASGLQAQVTKQVFRKTNPLASFKSSLMGLAFLLFASLTLNAAPMTNADVIKMVQAGINESAIVATIQNAENGFDISAGELTALGQANVPKSIINTIVLRVTSASTTPAPTTAAASTPDVASNVATDFVSDATATSASSAFSASSAVDPKEITLHDRGTRKTMLYLPLSSRSSSGGVGGIGGGGSYSVLQGANARTRTSLRPSFIIAIPAYAAPEGYVIVASFESRKNDTREVRSGGSSGVSVKGVGGGSSSEGIPQERQVAMTFEKLADQSKAPKKHVLYKSTPAQPLPSGEYAIFLDNKKSTDTKKHAYDFGVN